MKGYCSSPISRNAISLPRRPGSIPGRSAETTSRCFRSRCHRLSHTASMPPPTRRPRASSVFQVTVAARLHHVDRRTQPHRLGQRPHRNLADMDIILCRIDFAVQQLFELTVELDPGRGARVGRDLALREDLKQLGRSEEHTYELQSLML